MSEKRDGIIVQTSLLGAHIFGALAIIMVALYGMARGDGALILVMGMVAGFAYLGQLLIANGWDRGIMKLYYLGLFTTGMAVLMWAMAAFAKFAEATRDLIV